MPLLMLLETYPGISLSESEPEATVGGNPGPESAAVGSDPFQIRGKMSLKFKPFNKKNHLLSFYEDCQVHV